jgi:fatty-acyl-CoA synthase
MEKRIYHTKLTPASFLERSALVFPGKVAIVHGGMQVAINTCLNSQEVGFILKHSGSKFLFVDTELQPLVEPLTLEGIQIHAH